MNAKILRVHALTNTASGVAGEAAVTAALLRAGLRVARPFWTDDEIDLLVFWEGSFGLIPIPVQVKSVQAPSGEREAQTENLKKRYLESNPYLCLAIYSVARNKIWFIPKSESVKKVYSEWANAPKTGPGRPRAKYDAIDRATGTLDIRVDVSKGGNKEFDNKWLIDTEDASKLSKTFVVLAKEIQSDEGRIQALTKLVFEGAGGIKFSGSAEISVASGVPLPKATVDGVDEGLDLSTADEADTKLEELRGRRKAERKKADNRSKQKK